MKFGRITILAVFFTVALFSHFPVVSAAVMSSTNYKIEMDSINIGGVRQSSTSYFSEDTIGEIGTGKITDTSFYIFGGFLLPGVVGVEQVEEAPAPDGGGLSVISFQILDVVVQSITTNSATISWRTNKLSTSEFRYGTTEAYGNVISSEERRSAYTVVLENLSPATRYHFEIAAESDRGQRASSGNRTFKTLPVVVPAKEPPANVTNFEAIPEDERIQLTWDNPPDSDFEGVRIVRGTEFYPNNPFEGELVYEGTQEAFVDTGLQNGIRYYYTAFAYDRDGNFASGAIASAVPQVIIPGVPPEIVPPAPPLIPPELIPPSLRGLTLHDFDFIQEGVKLPVIEDRVEAKPDIPLTIAIDYEKLPEVLKTILTTLRDSDDKVFSFLLRIDEEKTRYLATVMPPEPGGYPMAFTVVDFKNQGLQKVGGELQIKPRELLPIRFPRDLKSGWYIVGLFLLLLLALLFVAAEKIIKKLNEMAEKRKRLGKKENMQENFHPPPDEDE